PAAFATPQRLDHPPPSTSGDAAPSCVALVRPQGTPLCAQVILPFPSRPASAFARRNWAIFRDPAGGTPRLVTPLGIPSPRFSCRLFLSANPSLAPGAAAPMPTPAAACRRPRALRRAWESDIAYRFRRSPVTVVAAVLTLLSVIAAFGAPWLAPHDTMDL